MHVLVLNQDSKLNVYFNTFKYTLLNTQLIACSDRIGHMHHNDNILFIIGTGIFKFITIGSIFSCINMQLPIFTDWSLCLLAAGLTFMIYNKTKTKIIL